MKPYVKRNKNDANDAEGIREAVTRPTMRFVAIKSAEQQSVLMMHRTRDLLVRQRTMLINALRAHLAPGSSPGQALLGVVAPTGVPHVKKLLAVIDDDADDRVPAPARSCLQGMARQYLSLRREIVAGEKRIHAWHRANEDSRRLETARGIGPLGASALTASIADPAVFKSGRMMAAWIGLTPRQNSTGGKQRLGRITKQGDPYLRWLLVAGAMSVIRQAKIHGTTDPWLAELIARKPTKVAAVALANKNARIAWALLRYGGTYQKPATAAA